MEPFKGLLERMLGRACDEAGDILTQTVKTYGLPIRQYLKGRAERFARQTNRYIGGRTVHEVPVPIILVLMEAGIKENEDDLQDRWAALFANYATGSYSNRTFPEILKRLSRDDADLLRTCLYAVLSPPAESEPLWKKSLTTFIDKWNLSREGKGLNISYDNLLSLRLLNDQALMYNAGRPIQEFTWLGYNFALACEAPENLPRSYS